MSYLISTKTDCENYDKYVSDKIGVDGTRVVNWANPRKHPDKNEWAIQVHDSYPPESGNVVSELPEDWTPQTPEI